MFARQKSKTLHRLQLDLTLSVKARAAFSHYINEVLSHLHSEQRFHNFACKKLILKMANQCKKLANKGATEDDIIKSVLKNLGEAKAQAQALIRETQKGQLGLINLLGFLGVMAYFTQQIIERYVYTAPLLFILVVLFSYMDSEANKVRRILIDKQGLKRKGAKKKSFILWNDIYRVEMPSKRRLIVIDRQQKKIKFLILFFPTYLISCVVKNSPSGVYIAPSLLSTYDKEMTKLESSLGFSDIYRQIILPEKVKASLTV